MERDERRIIAARFVALHWRDAALALPSHSPHRMMAHPLNLILDALDGETDPVQLGIGPEAWDDFRAALSGVPAPTEIAGEGEGLATAQPLDTKSPSPAPTVEYEQVGWLHDTGRMFVSGIKALPEGQARPEGWEPVYVKRTPPVAPEPEPS